MLGGKYRPFNYFAMLVGVHAEFSLKSTTCQAQLLVFDRVWEASLFARKSDGQRYTILIWVNENSLQN